MIHVAILLIAFGFSNGTPADSVQTQDASLRLSQPTRLQSHPLQSPHVAYANDHVTAVLRSKGPAASRATPYPRNMDRRDGLSEAVEERSRFLGPFLSRKPKVSKPEAPQNV